MASEGCTHDCSSCGSDCADRKEKFDFSAKLNAASHVKKVIAVASGKGGVGKSLVTTLLAVAAARKGLNVGILDADITGPSIPKSFGIEGGTVQGDDGIEPTVTDGGIRVMSLNMLVQDPTDPVVWRGPIIAGAVKQFWTDVHWGELDYLLVDMPPGTGDVPLTVFQSIPVDAAVVVTTPQALVGMIVEKAMNMAGMMNVPVKGLIENMSYALCPDCGKHVPVFGESHAEEIAGRFNTKVLARLPINGKLAAACDQGLIELFDGDWMDDAVREILK